MLTTSKKTSSRRALYVCKERLLVRVKTWAWQFLDIDSYVDEMRAALYLLQTECQELGKRITAVEQSTVRQPTPVPSATVQEVAALRRQITSLALLISVRQGNEAGLRAMVERHDTLIENALNMGRVISQIEEETPPLGLDGKEG